MALKVAHKHYPDPLKLPRFANQWISVSSKRIVISKDGTKLLCAEFSGCLGVIISGADNNLAWGAVAHLHQNFQLNEEKMQVRALSLIADFIRKATNDEIESVLLYYGDPQPGNPNENRVKEAMGCKHVIDLRRNSDHDRWGREFVYHPGQRIVYTAPTGAVYRIMSVEKEDGPDPFDYVLDPKRRVDNMAFQKFPFKDNETAMLMERVAGGGYYIDG